MRNAQKPDNVSLTNIVTRLRDGRYVIPDFQRDFEWQPWDISELMRSIFRDYYIGNLLLWKGKNETFDVLSCEPIYGFQGNSEGTHIVLDGQQRLTAMYYAFMAPEVSAPNRYNRYLYFIKVDKFMEEAYDDAFEYIWTSRGPNLLEDQEQQYETHMFPLSVVGKGGFALPNWLQGYEKYWEKKAESKEGSEAMIAKLHYDNAKAFSKHLEEITTEYQISFIEMDEDIEIDRVCDIFTKINSRGIRLDVFDLLNALLRPKGLKLRQELWRQSEPRLDFVETGRMNVYVLQVMSILLQGYCSPKYLYYLIPGNPRQVRGSDGVIRPEVLVVDKDDFEHRWNSSVDALEKAINLLRHPQEFGAISSQYLPYASILPAFAALQTAVENLPAEHRLQAQQKIRLWYWSSVFANRYSGSVESTSARDFLDVKAWFDNDDAEPGPIGEFKRNFRDIDLAREVRRGTSIYNGIYNLLILKGARDWISGHVPQHNNLDDHHIVPKSYGNILAAQTSIDSILNRTPLTAETNRQVIGNALPNEYLPKFIEDNGESEALAILESHFITKRAVKILMRDPFKPSDYENFVEERRRAFLEGIESLLVKERLDLSPQLRELDAWIEMVELGIRSTVFEALKGDVNSIPTHILQKIDERIRMAIRRNPALDSNHYNSLAGRLEYADLRELEDIIVNRALWENFESTFGGKGILATRFQQLSELRNGIRHSRSVDEITRMEGEAALLWFEKILKPVVQSVTNPETSDV